MKVDLKSSVQKQGKTVTQIVTALSGIKKTFRGVKTETIEQGEMTHFDTEDGRTILINTKNIAWVEVFKEDKSLVYTHTRCFGAGHQNGSICTDCEDDVRDKPIIAHHPTDCRKPNCEICPLTI